LNRFIGGDCEYGTEQRSAQDLDNFLHERVSAFQGRDTWQGTFIDNHDQMRTMVRLQKLGISEETERERRLDLATVLLLTVRGIPIVFYGDEQYLAYYDDGHDTPPQYINSDNDDPYNRPGMMSWDEDTPCFKIISTLALARQNSRAISEGEYKTIYADQDVLVFERLYGSEVVLVAVNRGDGKTIAIQTGIDITPGYYTGLLTQTSEVNQGNFLTVTQEGQATISLARLSALVVWASPPHP